MIICPLCEHIQERGLYCDVCGKAFPVRSVSDLDIPPMPGLETTNMGDMDLTAAGALPQGPSIGSGVQAGQSGMTASGEAPQTRCRACGQIQPAGQISCERCGTRLPRFLSEEKDEARPGEAEADENAPVVCRQCGVRARPAGGLCPVCGTRHSTEL